MPGFILKPINPIVEVKAMELAYAAGIAWRGLKVHERSPFLKMAEWHIKELRAAVTAVEQGREVLVG
jgi:hypothetical protein